MVVVTWDRDERPCARVINFEDDSFLCDILNTQIHQKMADAPNQCLNDGACDAKGRVWVGSKILASPSAESYVPADAGGDGGATGAMRPSPDAPPAGALFCCESAFAFRGGRATAVGSAQKVDEVGGVHVSNGIGWSPDGCTMYYADSPRRCVLGYDYDVNSGILRNERVFAAVAEQCGDGGGGGGGVPDGLAVDVEGGVWVCLWDAGKVVRYLPDPGGGGGGGAAVDRVIETPCSRPMSACFGGAAGSCRLLVRLHIPIPVSIRIRSKTHTK